jgi:hypothetical protein
MKNIQEMSRQDILLELARHADPQWYQSLIEWDNAQLKALLMYYREGGKYPSRMVGRIYTTKGLGDTNKPRFIIGIDFGKDEYACYTYFEKIK